MILTDENRSTGRKSYLSVTPSTTNLTSADLGSRPGLPAERPATNRLSHGADSAFQLAVEDTNAAVV